MNESVPTYPYGVASMDNKAILAGTILSSIFFFACFFSAFWIVINRDSRLVEQSQPIAGFLSLFSLTLLHGAILTGLGRPMNLGLCIGRVWGAMLALCCFLLAQLMKGWTLFRYSQTSKSRFMKVAEERSLAVAMTILGLFSIILVLWTVFEPISPTSSGEGCVSQGTTAEIVALTCLGLVWLFWAFFSSQTYELKSRLTDYGYITSFVSGLGAITTIVATHSLQTTVFTPDIMFLTEAVCASVTSLLVIGFGVIPKVWGDENMTQEMIEYIHKEEGVIIPRAPRRGTSASTMTRTGSLPSMESGSHKNRGQGKSKRRRKNLSRMRSSLTSGAQTPERSQHGPDQTVHSITIHTPPPSFLEEGQWL